MQILVCFDTKVDPVVGYGTSDVVDVQVRALLGIPTQDQSLCTGPKGFKPPAVPPKLPRTFVLESWPRFDSYVENWNFPT